jgi:hypothetical protein
VYNLAYLDDAGVRVEHRLVDVDGLGPNHIHYHLKVDFVYFRAVSGGGQPFFVHKRMGLDILLGSFQGAVNPFGEDDLKQLEMFRFFAL